MKLTSLISFTCLVLYDVTCQPLTPQQEQDFRTFIEATMACRDNAAVSVALVRNGETVFSEGFGLRDVPNQLPMTSSTRINIGSLTKAFTASLCAHSVSNGLVSWDAPLRDVLGENFGMEGPFRTAQLNLRDALAHKIGVPSYWGVSTSGINATREEICMERMNHFPTMYDFRSRYKYSNYPYVLAGYVQEVVTGLSWQDSLTSTILQPLGMINTLPSTMLTTADWDDTAYSYIHQDGEYVQNPEQDQLPFVQQIEPAAGIFSTAEDMAEWMKFHLNKGQLTTGEVIIPSDELEETHTAAFSKGRESPRIQKPSFPVDDMSLTKALGWRNGMYRGHEKIYHTGSYSSYNCRMNLLTDVDVGVWACVNSPGDYRGSRAVTTINSYGLDLLLDEEPWLNTTTTCTYPDPWRSVSGMEEWDEEEQVNHRAAPPTLPTISGGHHRAADEAYVGVYVHPAFGEFVIFQNVSDLSLHYEFGLLLSGDLNFSGTPELYYMTLNPPISYRMTFFPEYPEGFPVYFTRDSESGLVTSIQVDYLEFDLPPVFVRQ